MRCRASVTFPRLRSFIRRMRQWLNCGCPKATICLMSAITATLAVEDDVATVVANMLRQFPKGSRVKLAISEVPATAPVPSLDEYRRLVAAARQQAPGSPWKTTAETMKALREGEED